MKKRRSVPIANLVVGGGQPVCIVAELGVNHLGDFDLAKEMIQAAHEAGADLLKFQTYTADERYDSKRNPRGPQFIEMLRRWQFSREEEARLWEYARSLGATVFTSAFDPASVDFAEEMGSAAYKLAAFEVVNHELVRAAASKGKAIIFSRGMASLEEIDAVVEICEEAGAPCIILHTISSYPLEKKDSHLQMIHVLRDRYSWPVGHSDHTPGVVIPPLAVAAGAQMIEKHFTITPKRRESDNFFSITPEELKELVFKVRQVETWMGEEIVKIPTEEYMWDFRRATP